MGAALTYARRYALFALVGIAGEDDLDAPDTLIEPSPTSDREAQRTLQKPTNGTVHRPYKRPVLDAANSNQLRDQLLAEIGDLKDGEDLALWAHRRLPSKNTLVADDARAIETAYQARLEGAARTDPDALPTSAAKPTPMTETSEAAATVESAVGYLAKPVRRRSKAHLLFVGAQPCLICRRVPSDAHHLKFAQTRGRSIKVSDEFTVPLCRVHHQELHRHGNEAAWWANLHIAPLQIAKQLWQTSPIHDGTGRPNLLPNPSTGSDRAVQPNQV